MKVLIIGGTGLISTAISRQLLAKGVEVTLYNRGQSDVRFGDGASFIHGDRRDYPAFEAQMQEAGEFDVVIDMISFGPEDAESGVRAFAGRIKQFIFCSTVCAYGGPATHYPIREDEPRMPVDGYGLNKGKCEDILMAAHARGDFATTVIRPSQTYGEGGTIVNTLGWDTSYLDRIRKGKPIIVHGDGSCLWAACHVDDVAGAFVGACLNEKAYGNFYNATGEEWMTWNRYHELVAEALGAPKPTFVHIPTDVLGKLAPDRAGITVNIFQYPSIFDNSAAIADLGFAQTVSWVEGVKRTVAWLDEQGKVRNSDEDPLEDQIISAWERATAELTL